MEAQASQLDVCPRDQLPVHIIQNPPGYFWELRIKPGYMAVVTC